MKTAYLYCNIGFPLKLESEIPNDLIVNGPGLEVSDGYHTINELYNHRYVLFYALVKIYDNYVTPLGCNVKCWKSKLHDDGTMFDNSFIVGMTLVRFDFNGNKDIKYITYHYPLDWWNKFKIMELSNAPKYDGHTSDDVIERLMGL